jgi:predicted ArsR family transcriptional regulator
VAGLTDTKRRVVDALKRAHTATVPELAAAFGLTDTAVRQHLEALEVAELVERVPAAPAGRGRPAVRWRLTDQAASLFPDRHGDLTVELLTSIRAALGDDGLDRVVQARTSAQEQAYRAALPDPTATTVVDRVRRLAALRSAEGYLAEASEQPDGSVVLVEHHCPISEAAHACQGFCGGELAVFRAVLGTDVSVERTQHLLAGDRRCSYLVRPAV